MKKTFYFLTCILALVLLVGCGGTDTLPEMDISAPLDAYHIQGTYVTEWQPTDDEIAALGEWYASLEVKHKTFKEGESPSDKDGGEVYNFSTENDEFSYVLGDKNYILTGEKWYMVKNPSLPPVKTPEPNNVEAVAGQAKSAVIPMVKIGGEFYYDTGRTSDALRCGVMDGKITSSVDGTEIPSEDNQSNFGCYGYQWGSEKNTVEVNIDDKWVIFEKRGGDGSMVRYKDRWYDKSTLSAETLEWLNSYNALSAEEQLEVSDAPAELSEQ